MHSSLTAAGAVTVDYGTAGAAADGADEAAATEYEDGGGAAVGEDDWCDEDGAGAAAFGDDSRQTVATEWVRPVPP